MRDDRPTMPRAGLTERDARELCALAAAVLVAMNHDGLGTMIGSVVAHDLSDRAWRLRAARNYLEMARCRRQPESAQI